VTESNLLDDEGVKLSLSGHTTGLKGGTDTNSSTLRLPSKNEVTSARAYPFIAAGNDSE
jgi:hypothetical protein